MAQPASWFVYRASNRSTDVLHAHRSTLPVGEDRRIVRFRLQKLVICIKGIGDARAVQSAFGKIYILLADHIAHILKADAAVRKGDGIHLNADGRLLLSTDTNQPDASI